MKGWKTAALAAGVTLLGAAQKFFESVEMSADTQGIVLMVIGGLIAAARAVTSTPMFKSE